MARLRQAFGVIVAAVRMILAFVHYIQRKRLKDEQRPRLRLDFIHPPSWGAEKLDFAITNTGGGRAHNCRYCRLQEFTMAGAEGRPASFSARRWYSSDRLDLPPGVQKRAPAALTMSACPRDVLGDVIESHPNESFYQDAIVCRDSVGTAYRFRCYLGPDGTPDVWSAGLLDRFRGISPPAWVQWASRSTPVERINWSDAT